jgi:tRNA (cytidine/uridine-2'-O-)-methyltransferase
MEPIPPPRLHVVLVAPEVHWNTGNIGRTCLGAGAALHLVRPLGFSLESRRIKRAGLDYWPKVDLSVWDDFNHFQEVMRPTESEMALLTKSGAHPYWQITPRQRLFLIFGSETIGLPAELLSCFSKRTFYIPISRQIRCLNLSTAVGIALYESIRRIRAPE